MNKLENALKIKVYIASDHGGFLMKEDLKNAGLDFLDLIDLGTNSNASVDYPDYAKILAEHVIDNNSYGIAICGTGIGISVALNKIKNIYAAPINNVQFAKLAKEHNNLNVICLSGRFVDLKTNIEILKSFFSTAFDERHQTRIKKLKEIENHSW